MNISIIVPCYNEETNICLDAHSMPNTLRWRQALPLLFVFFLFALIVLSLFTTFARYLLAVQLLGYFFCFDPGRLETRNRKKYGIPFAWTAARDLHHVHGLGRGIFVERHFRSIQKAWLISTDLH